MSALAALIQEHDDDELTRRVVRLTRYGCLRYGELAEDGQFDIELA